MSWNARSGRMMMSTAARNYRNGRSAILLAVIFTVVNTGLSLAGTDLYFLFSLTLPYVEFSLSPIGIALFVIPVGYFVACYILSKKNRGALVGALVGVLIDSAYLGWVVYQVITSTAEVDLLDFLLDLIFHAVIVVDLVIGVVASGKYFREQKEAEAAANLPATDPTQTGF